MKIKLLYLMLFMLFVILIVTGIVETKGMYYLSNSKVYYSQDVYIQRNKMERSDIVLIGGDVHVYGNTYGNITSIFGKVIVHKDGRTFGRIKEYNPNDIIINKFTYFKLFVMLTIFEILIFKFMGKKQVKTADKLMHFLKENFLCGYSAILISVFAIVILAITIVGVSLIPIFILSMIVIFLIGNTAVNLHIGQKVIGKFVSLRSSVFEIIMGNIICFIIKQITTFHIGFWVWTLIIVPISIGIALNSRFGTFEPWKRKTMIT